MPQYICSNCLNMVDFEVCEVCGSEVVIVLEFRSGKHTNHYQVFAEGMYVGEIYKAHLQYEGEPYPILNKQLRKEGILQIEEHVPIHRTKFMLWTFLNNPEEPYSDYQQATIALYKMKGFAYDH